jgi:regulator of protease activity HflC (stomatin/prohibitin superfamily)
LKLLSIGKVELPEILRDQVYPPQKSVDAIEFQSVEGLSLGIDFSVRYALDPEKILTMARNLPDDINGTVVQPIIHDAFHRTLARYTVREIFSDRRQEIQEHITKEMQTRLADEGIKLKLLTIGKVKLPEDYKRGLEKLLAAEQATEQMRYTLELKDKEVKQSELVAMADKVRREKAAEAAGEEQVIAAKAQAEAMKHILPFKEKQIQQRALEAEADKVTRLQNAQANADARRIEAEAEADSRKKLAEAEAFRMEQIGRVSSDQMAREGAILAQSPLLIQKSLADKLSDKISVIIAPPSASGGFIAENIIGRLPAAVSNNNGNNEE